MTRAYKLAQELEPGDKYGKAKVVRVLEPLTPKDLVVTIVLDNDEVIRIDKTSTLRVSQ